MLWSYKIHSEACRIFLMNFDCCHPDIAFSLTNLARCCSACNMKSESVELIQKALLVWHTSEAPQHPLVYRSKFEHARLMSSMDFTIKDRIIYYKTMIHEMETRGLNLTFTYDLARRCLEMLIYRENRYAHSLKRITHS